jgi:hypothetical protein
MALGGPPERRGPWLGPRVRALGHTARAISRRDGITGGVRYRRLRLGPIGGVVQVARGGEVCVVNLPIEERPWLGCLHDAYR